jgi:hypothetical protein
VKILLSSSSRNCNRASHPTYLPSSHPADPTRKLRRKSPKKNVGSTWRLYLPRRRRRDPACLLHDLSGLRFRAVLAPRVPPLGRLGHLSHLLDPTCARCVLSARFYQLSHRFSLWRRTHLPGNRFGSTDAVEHWVVREGVSLSSPPRRGVKDRKS